LSSFGRQRAGREPGAAVEGCIDEHEPGGLGSPAAAGIGAQHGRRRGFAAREHAQFAPREPAALARHERVGGADALGEIQPRPAAQGGVGFADLAGRRHGFARAEFETHGDQQAVAECGRDQERPLDAALDHLVGHEGLRQPFAERRFGEGEDRSESAQPLVLVGRPAGLAIPPAQRREGAVEPGESQRGDVLGREAGRPGQQSAVGSLPADRLADLGPDLPWNAAGVQAAKSSHAGPRQPHDVAGEAIDEAPAQGFVGEADGHAVPIFGRDTRVQGA
jgi:hypothetical protein